MMFFNQTASTQDGTIIGKNGFFTGEKVGLVYSDGNGNYHFQITVTSRVYASPKSKGENTN